MLACERLQSHPSQKGTLQSGMVIQDPHLYSKSHEVLEKDGFVGKVYQIFKQRKFMFHINFRNREEKLPNSLYKNRISLIPDKNGKVKERYLWVHFAYELHMKKKS